jgi:hypothetical protein
MKGFIEITAGRDNNRRLSIAVKYIISFKEASREGQTVLTLTSIEKEGISETITVHLPYAEVVELIEAATR